MPVRAALLASFLLSACGTARPYSPAPAQAEVGLSEVVVGGTSALRADVPMDRSLVRSATLRMTVDGAEEAAEALDAAGALATALGGYVEREGPREAVLRVPDGRLDDALRQLAALGDADRPEVLVQDVTDQAVDLRVRLTNARALQGRLRDLLDRAESVEDVLAVERELARVTTEVERLAGQLQALEDRVALSAVRLEVREAVRPGPLGYVLVGAYEAVKWLFVRG